MFERGKFVEFLDGERQLAGGRRWLGDARAGRYVVGSQGRLDVFADAVNVMESDRTEAAGCCRRMAP